ncbi:MAG TPA: cytochrome c oxidase subunit 3 [Candidatus Sumerlaeota bacterium]|nr:cytochrome c oxidase subunit 3 [Candidatus Sumerlaeota bacterium]HOR27103.1 cytochrome c oxidase subunit 3 [Candidatus Sumerlaeota bacterium]
MEHVELASRTTAPHHQFDDLLQQRRAYEMGMWIFLVTELLLFGGLFLGYAVYRNLHTAAFQAGSRELNLLAGAINTAVLLVSSLTMALALHALQLARRRAAARLLALTALLGALFLAIKAWEYTSHVLHHKFPGALFQSSGPHPGPLELFYSFYFAMTGLHAAHMLVGLVVCAIMIGLLRRGRFTPESHAPLEMTGLYWHFVDIVWIFLFPLLYLMGYPQ